MSAAAELAAVVRRQVETRRAAGAGVLEALADVRQMYADVITRLIAAEKTVPESVLKRYEIINDWEETVTFNIADSLDTTCQPQ